MKKALVTGGTGFIGRALVKKLFQAGYSVRVVTRRDPSEVIMPEAEVVRASFNDQESLKRALSGCSVVFHLAAALYAYSKEEYEQANTIATANLARAAIKASPAPKRFVYVSSIAAGGPSPDCKKPRTEDDKENPVSFYGTTKLGGEKELQKLPDGIEKVILRPPIVYGKKDAGLSAIAKWVNRGIMLRAGSGGEIFFSFIFLDDLVETLKIAAESGNMAGKTYYVCDDRIYTWSFYIAQIAKGMNRKMPWMINLSEKKVLFAGHVYEILSRLTGLEPVFNRDKAREACAGHWIASPGKWMADSGWLKWTPIAEGMRRIFEAHNI